MRAYRLTAPGRRRWSTCASRAARGGEVVLRVLAAGVCRTDLELRAHGGAARLPVTLGHEIVGEVIDAGQGVEPARRATLVAVYELIGCGRARPAHAGEDNVCREGVPGACRASPATAAWPSASSVPARNARGTSAASIPLAGRAADGCRA